ncbi:hypothetical protein PRVXH_001393 [Proteinivorax hydrogeniformans]|uniref:Uncharacterized protein n=1 Tax=Proteinivorax hydrogeniformans TaxID=1826727 RepID=A0AAU8HQI3_9FIRM
MSFKPIDLQVLIPKSGKVGKLINNYGEQLNQLGLQQQTTQLSHMKLKTVQKNENAHGPSVKAKHKDKEDKKNSSKNQNVTSKDSTKKQSQDSIAIDPNKGKYVDINI